MSTLLHVPIATEIINVIASYFKRIFLIPQMWNDMERFPPVFQTFWKDGVVRPSWQRCSLSNKTYFCIHKLQTDVTVRSLIAALVFFFFFFFGGREGKLKSK
ncbi:unnamed protein product [Prunus armeniaca]